uniref:Uncharacterized protein n=1 Tax=Fagus sylvatica TaxID=28930 RepID=A0A2N9FX18_FAGSY
MSNIGSWRTSTSRRGRSKQISPRFALADSGGGRGYCARAMTDGGLSVREKRRGGRFLARETRRGKGGGCARRGRLEVAGGGSGRT